MKLTKTLLRESLKHLGYPTERINKITLTRDYTHDPVIPLISMFSIKLRITNVTDGTITVLREWGEKLNYELRYWKVKCEGWSNLNADRDKTQYYIDLTVKFRRKE